MIELSVGKDVMVFDYRLFQKNGGDSDTDNFMRKASILRIYGEDELKGQYIGTSKIGRRKVEETLIDVRFYHDGHISKSHFASAVEDCK